MIEAQDAVPIIPNRSTTIAHAFSRELYRLCNRVELFFDKTQTVPARRDTLRKRAANHLAIINIAMDSHPVAC